MTAKELIQKIKELKPKGIRGHLRNLVELHNIEPEKRPIPEVGEFKEVGDYIYESDFERQIVFEFPEHGIFLAQWGFYSSYGGTEWEKEISEVKPEIEQKIVYKKV